MPRVGGESILNVASLLSHEGGLTVLHGLEVEWHSQQRLLSNEGAGKGQRHHSRVLAREMDRPLIQDKERAASLLGRIPKDMWGDTRRL